ncbi:MAG: 3-hydroxyacyl-CoA dehydrogenase NAD-binding domain-containing protein, partial [Rhodospirillales bacterium]|nr:3-hydroxyacyl-CoA dehydrogenase NAD-binding domain-containing protein [Rhodospirillales bacterium]
MSVDIRKIGVVGAGQMGIGISHVFALGGFDVHLIDSDPNALEAGLAAVDHYLGREVSKERINDEQRQAALARISRSDDHADLADCDLVVEAVTEDEQAKTAVYKEVCPHLKPEAILASNTSCISITRLGAQTDRPGRFLGMHFMYPAPALELVELIRGIATEEKAFHTISDLVVKLGKTPVNSEDFSA